MMIHSCIGYLLSAFLLLVSPAAFACPDIVYPDDRDILSADAIIVGELVDYKLVYLDESNPRYRYGLLTYSVAETIKGKADGTINVIWYNSAFGVPDEMEISGIKEIVAFAFTKSANSAVDAYHLFQPPCSSPFIRVYTPENVAILREWVANGVADERTLAFSESPLREASARNVEEDTPAQRVPMWLQLFLAMGGLAALCIAFWWLARHRNLDV